MKKVILQFSLLTILLGVISTAIYFTIPSIPISKSFPFILLFLYLTNLFVLFILHKYMYQRTSLFANAIMLANFGKMVFYALVIFIFAYLNREHAVSFILTFFAYYFIFTIYEVFALLKMKKD